MAINQLQQKIINDDDIISNLKEKLNYFFNDLITIEKEKEIINICWFSNSDILEKQIKEQEILKNLDIMIYPLIWDKIRNWNLNEKDIYQKPVESPTRNENGLSKGIILKN